METLVKQKWQTKKLDEVTHLITCGVAARPKYASSGVPFLSAKNVKNGKIIWSDFKFITKEKHKELTKNNKPLRGDLLYTRVGSYGEAAVIESDEEFSLFVSLTLIKPNKEILNPYFLKYYLNSDVVKRLAKNSISGSGVGNLNVSTVRKFAISIPDLEEQQRIVSILDEAFAEIDKAKKITEQNLKNAREIFESYLQALEGHKEPLGLFVDIVTGRLDANAAKDDGQYPFFTCSKEIFMIDKFAFDCEAILLAGNNAVGDFNVKHYKGKFNAYQRTYVITIHDEANLIYRYLYFQLLQSLKEFKIRSVGAGTKFLKIGMIKDLEIILPPIQEQEHIVTKLDALNEELKELEVTYQQKLITLDELKKSILNKAFKGEL